MAGAPVRLDLINPSLKSRPLFVQPGAKAKAHGPAISGDLHEQAMHQGLHHTARRIQHDDNEWLHSRLAVAGGGGGGG